MEAEISMLPRQNLEGQLVGDPRRIGPDQLWAGDLGPPGVNLVVMINSEPVA